MFDDDFYASVNIWYKQPNECAGQKMLTLAHLKLAVIFTDVCARCDEH